MNRFLWRRILGGPATLLACLLLASPARGLVLHTDAMPTDTPNPAVVGRWSYNASAVAIGPNHILTTRHQYGGAGGSVWFNGVEYRVGAIRTPDQDGLAYADIRVAQIWTLDGKPANLTNFVGTYAARDEVGQEIRIGGFGWGRGSTLLASKNGLPYGYNWQGSDNHTERWGANEVLTTWDSFPVSPWTSDTLVLDFDAPGHGGSVPYEAAGALYDSGGGWFILDTDGKWKVAALTAYADHGSSYQTWFGSSTNAADDPDWNWGIRVSSYASWIAAHSAQYQVPPGDASMDGKTDVVDLGILGAHYGQTGQSWTTGDFSGDGKVDVIDLGLLGAHYGDGVNGAPDAFAAGVAVPEPAGLLVLAFGAMNLLRRRRQA